jgi:hypothetical protein
MNISNESKESHVDPYDSLLREGCRRLWDQRLEVTTCSRLSESAGGLEHSAGCPEGTPCGVNRVREWSLM